MFTRSNTFYFIFVGMFWLCSWVYICIFHYFNYSFPDFLTTICLGFIFGFLFWGISFNLTKCYNKPLVESSFLTKNEALSLWSGDTDSKTLDYQRTNPREYQILRTQTKKNAWRPSITQPPVAPWAGCLI